jgi:hypothetical protein
MLDELRLRIPAKKKRTTCRKRLMSIRQWISHKFQAAWTSVKLMKSARINS